MVSINYSAREVCCKIVYYGPGLSGKTTNLQYVHSKVPGNTRGKLISLATEADRTLYFDFLPLNIGTINGFSAKFQLYTVPGQVYYNATRKLVLRGVDGVVFVADSQPDKMDENIESLTNLEENLREYGYDLDTLPVAIQYNKRDLPGVLPVEVLQEKLNTHNWPHFEASATIGNGVFDTLKLIIKLVLDKAKKTSAPRVRPSGTGQVATPAASAAPTAQPQVQPQPMMQRVPAEPMAAQQHQAPTPQPAPQQVPEPVHASAPSPEPQQPVYRPYPGTDASGKIAQPQKKISPTTFSPAGKEELPAESLEKHVAMSDGAPSEEPSQDTSQPQMARSLKRRGETKKRGFFKRLFGIK